MFDCAEVNMGGGVRWGSDPELPQVGLHLSAVVCALADMSACAGTVGLVRTRE